mgnify:CR=1 FL=1
MTSAGWDVGGANGGTGLNFSLPSFNSRNTKPSVFTEGFDWWSLQDSNL